MVSSTYRILNYPQDQTRRHLSTHALIVYEKTGLYHIKAVYDLKQLNYDSFPNTAHSYFYF